MRAAVFAVGLMLLVAGCGGGSDDGHGHAQPSATPSAVPSVAATAFNATDVQFATDMIPHHRQAVDMAALAASKASSAEVKALAAKIRKAQEPEIATMSGWLTAWGEPVPSPDAMHHDMGDMGGMPGMLTDTELRRLGAASGAAFDKLFLTLMIKHHEGAVETATTAQAQGVAVKQLAGEIVKSQTGEITEMKALLDKLP
ncbi:DUF305 domain-containing protein [Dactylosporangium sp. NBC_01737]|uniref:DUF305 domain-containing protein n=1 Tax=Dactylosporangium sp. NBC_01737 TaxID=2975959 RepID=UPI002E0E592F|nr:DUF305 domain-containing protein [Dactylosporangium sp. NBC_01737]